MRTLGAVLILCAWAANAAAPKSKAKPKPAPAQAPVAAPAAPAEPSPAPAPRAKPPPAAARAAPTAGSLELLQRVGELYGSLEYDKVIPLGEELVQRADLTLDQRLEAYRLLGSAKAIVQDPVDAEKPFRLLLRARPDYDLPQDTPPKILGVFRKVQTEEKALALQLREVERARIVASLKLLGEVPQTWQGGRVLPFSFRLRDPTNSVDSVRVPYRREGQPVFSTLALERSTEGDWKGRIPGEFTSDEKGFKLQYYVELVDAQGTLLSSGTALAPRIIDVAPGTVSRAKPPPLPRWAFFTGVAVTSVFGAAAGGLGAAFNITQSNYTRRTGAAPSDGQPLDGALLASQANTGRALALSTNVALISTGVAAVATLLLIPFTNFRGEESP